MKLLKCLLVFFVIFLLGSAVALWLQHRLSLPFLSKGWLLGKTTTVSPVATIPAFDWLSLQKKVLPEEGFHLKAAFEDLGPKLLEAGAIDLVKFEKNYERSGGLTAEQKKILTEKNDVPISISQSNAGFMVNFFWALGLASKNPILDNGPMIKNRSQLGNFASTGGWTLGKKTATELYSKSNLINLTEDQQKIVQKVADGVFRPCCGNPTSFPDCNHGMAALGLAEYLASKGLTEEEIFNALLKFNSFWFPQTYLDLAAYLKLQGTDWSQVSAQLVLGKDYSSGQGYARVKRELDTKMGVKAPGGLSGNGCGT